ncbi:thiol:disulfide interchange protein DsbA/DsbL [Aestuariibacter salexigens]|uniref:thiol:disulfide interchange protein DsbA/DsbL n=1 Tax=Aestuariibacter salexigens TaxID=226010 RepID=UPI000402FBB6|nr:thiol:disulfide interchange protein DsbA/DsbL [Aestuariibacter salexigens]
MKKLFALLLLTLLLPLQACAQEQWQEGTHYEIISDEATAQPEVMEFFSFWCPACFRFEPLVGQIKQQLADDVKFTKVHVNFMGFTGPDVQDAATRAMMVARALKKEEAMNQAIFNYIHVQRSTITGLDDLRNIFIVAGVEPEDFDKMAKSFGINSQLQKNNKLIDDYRSHLRGVPNFIVNGKYQAKFTRDMTADDIVDLIVWLSKQK